MRICGDFMMLESKRRDMGDTPNSAADAGEGKTGLEHSEESVD